MIVACAALLAGAGAVVTPQSAAAVEHPPITCQDGAQPVYLYGVWRCVVVAGGFDGDGGPLAIVEPPTGGGDHQQWCPNPLGLGPPGWGGSPEPYAPDPGATVPCELPILGWWDGTQCYYREVGMATPLDPGWDEHGPGSLRYERKCFLDAMNANGEWFGEPEEVVLPGRPDFEGGEPPVVLRLWMEAVNELMMRGPEIATAPPLENAGLVRLPTWLWTETSPHTWPEPDELTATAGPVAGEWVTAWAHAEQIEWHMGDGSDPVTCEHAGTVWQPDLGAHPGDHECVHLYLRASRHEPDGVFEITAITTWHLEWEINGVWDGELRLQAATTTPYRVNEVQVLVTYR
jgi:hypothetical protein